MIQSRKIKLFLTAIIISVVMTLLPFQTEAKDKIYLNRTQITLNVGQTKKLSLISNKKNVKKKVKWTSKNKKKVSVDRKGVSTDGYIRTYFKPDKGKAYFDQQ